MKERWLFGIVAIVLGLLYLRIDHNLARAVTVQKCVGAACVDICDGFLQTMGDRLTYRIHCNDTIFTDGFE